MCRPVGSGSGALPGRSFGTVGASPEVATLSDPACKKGRGLGPEGGKPVIGRLHRGQPLPGLGENVQGMGPTPLVPVGHGKEEPGFGGVGVLLVLNLLQQGDTRRPPPETVKG